MQQQPTRPSPRLLARLTTANLVANVVIVITGGAVRLSGSGLGCPEWPTCNAGSVVPLPDAQVAWWHQAIEFGNRLLAGVVLAIAVATLVAAWRSRHRWPGAVGLAALVVAGVVAQAVVGGVTVLLGLHPLTVAAHFLLSIVIIAVAVALRHRVHTSPGDPAVAVRRELRWGQHLVVAVTAVVIAIGTLVTASGPHAGDPGTPRLGFDPRVISQFHADGVFLLLGLTVALWLGLRATAAPRAAQRATLTLLGVSLAQGIIGYIQYFTGLPELLVGAHLLGACLVWIAAVRLWLVSRVAADDRADAPAERPGAMMA